MKTLRVGYAGSAPFISEGKPADGIVIDIWRAISFNQNLKSDLKAYHSVHEGMDAVRAGELDVLIGPITINSDRTKQITFSQPFYDTEMAILAPKIELTFWDHLSPFFSKTFLFAILGLLIILGIVGVLFYVIEGRKFPEEYGEKPIKGIGTGVWLAITTMTTVGYGDFAPKTTPGRFLLGAWMIISLIMATTFVAGIASTLTTTNLQDKTIVELNQMEDKRIATPNFKKIIDKVKAIGGTPLAVNNVNEAYGLLKNGEVDAILYDLVPLEYVRTKKDKEKYLLSKKNIQPQHYGFVFPLNSEFRRDIDLGILELKEADEIMDITENWLSKRD